MEVEVEMEYEGPRPGVLQRDAPGPEELDPDQQERLRVIAGQCPVHRALSSETEVAITDEVDLRLRRWTSG